MTEAEETFDKSTLLARNEASWTALWAVIDAHDESELTRRRDAGGWSAKDHLGHLTAWERSVVFLLNGLALTDGMGIDEDLYRAGDLDAINAGIQDQVKDLALADVLTDLRAVHEEMLGTIEGMPEDALRQPVDAEGVLGDQSPPKVAEKIAWNTFEHFDQHRGWIEALLQEERG